MGGQLTSDKNFSYGNQFYTDAVAEKENPNISPEEPSDVPWDYPNFKVDEFNQRGNPLPTEDIRKVMNPILLEKLELLREAIGNKPIIVTSGYRNAIYNKKQGGAKNSQHMYGNAADIIVRGMTSKELDPIAKEVGFTYTETYDDKPHLHVDVRGLTND